MMLLSLAFAYWPMGWITLAVIAASVAASWVLQRLRRRSPFTRHLLREPGHIAKNKLDVATSSLVAHWIALMVLLLLVNIVFVRLRASAWDDAGLWFWLNISSFGVGIAWLLRNLWKLWRRIQRLRLRWDAEMAVGHGLNQLMRLGYRVFHDVEEETAGPKIDHVVLGKEGIYAVRTTYHKIPRRRFGRRANGTADKPEASFDGQRLNLAGGFDVLTPKRAKDDADRLGNMLSKAIGDIVRVRPAIALPGWRVKSLNWDRTVVFDPANPLFLVQSHKDQRNLDNQLTKQLVLQIEKWVRYTGVKEQR